MKLYLEQLSEQHSLSEQEMEKAVQRLFSDDVSDSEMAAFIIGLKMKGETVNEIVGLVNVMRKYAMSFSNNVTDVIDNCGTGGDGSKSFNISTTSAFVMAGAGLTIAKHGNRSISSKTGSADVLEHLGVNLNLPSEATEELLNENGISFLYAPFVHPKVKRIMKVRKDLRIPTIFNLIGPLTNPFDLDYQLLGIYRRDLLEMFATVLNKLGRKRAIVLNGAGFMDEASLEGENHLAIVDHGTITKRILRPEDVGLSTYSNKDIVGGAPKENAEILLRVLKGEKGAYRDTVLLNAGLGIYTAQKAESIEAGIQTARESIDSGAALSKLQKLIELSQGYQQEVI